MTMLDFARGPALEASLVIFVAGTIWRLLGALLLPWRLIAAEPRKGAPPLFVAALKGIVVKLWPYETVSEVRRGAVRQRLHLPYRTGDRRLPVRAAYPLHQEPDRAELARACRTI